MTPQDRRYNEIKQQHLDEHDHELQDGGFEENFTDGPYKQLLDDFYPEGKDLSYNSMQELKQKLKSLREAHDLNPRKNRNRFELKEHTEQVNDTKYVMQFEVPTERERMWQKVTEKNEPTLQDKQDFIKEHGDPVMHENNPFRKDEILRRDTEMRKNFDNNMRRDQQIRNQMDQQRSVNEKRTRNMERRSTAFEIEV
jgi:hypothetical protein